MHDPTRPLLTHLHRRDFLRAGAWLTGAALLPDAPAKPFDNAIFPIREAYCPAHFGNSYEAMGPREMAAYLTELKWMGFNRYGDWLTTTDVINPYTSDNPRFIPPAWFASWPKATGDGAKIPGVKKEQ